MRGGDDGSGVGVAMVSAGGDDGAEGDDGRCRGRRCCGGEDDMGPDDGRP